MFKTSQESEVSNAIKYVTSCYCGLISKSLGRASEDKDVGKRSFFFQAGKESGN